MQTLLATIFDRKLRKTKSLVDYFLQFSPHHKESQNSTGQREEAFQFCRAKNILYSLHIELGISYFLPDHHLVYSFLILHPHQRECLSIELCSNSSFVYISITEASYYVCHYYLFTCLPHQHVSHLSWYHQHVVLSLRKKITEYNDDYMYFGLGTKQYLEIGCLKLQRKIFGSLYRVP